jgi:hypothetical protein
VAGENRVDGTDAARLFDGADPGGVEICTEAIDWLKNYRDVAKPGVHFTAVARENDAAVGVPAELLGG